MLCSYYINIYLLAYRGTKRTMIRSTAPKFLRFMTLSKNKSSEYLHLLQQLLLPDILQSVLLAIKSGDSSKLPKNFQTGCRKLTAVNEKKLQKVKSESTEKALKSVSNTVAADGGQVDRLISAAALELSALNLSHLTDSSVCTLVVGKSGEVSLKR